MLFYITKIKLLCLKVLLMETRSEPYLVIAGNSNIHMLQWGVCITQGNDRNVHIGGLSDWLMISSRVCHH